MNQSHFIFYLLIVLLVCLVHENLPAADKTNKIGFNLNTGIFSAPAAKYDLDLTFGYFGIAWQKELSIYYQYDKFLIKFSHSNKAYRNQLDEVYWYPYFKYLEVKKHSINLATWSGNLYLQFKSLYLGAGYDLYNIEEKMQNITIDYFNKIEGNYKKNTTYGLHFDVGARIKIKLSKVIFLEPVYGITYYYIYSEFNSLQRERSYKFHYGFYLYIGSDISFTF